MRKFPFKTPRWVTSEQYFDLYKSTTVILRREWHTDKHLLAPKPYIVVKPIFTTWDASVSIYWRLARNGVRFCVRRGWLKPIQGDRICWSSIKVWRKAARKQVNT